MLFRLKDDDDADGENVVSCLDLLYIYLNDLLGALAGLSLS